MKEPEWYGPGRCEICGWPLAARAADGCVPDNCSFRPDDEDTKRRLRERRQELQAWKTYLARAPGMQMLLEGNWKLDDSSGLKLAWPPEITSVIDAYQEAIAKATFPSSPAGPAPTSVPIGEQDDFGGYFIIGDASGTSYDLDDDGDDDQDMGDDQPPAVQLQEEDRFAMIAEDPVAVARAAAARPKPISIGDLVQVTVTGRPPAQPSRSGQVGYDSNGRPGIFDERGDLVSRGTVVALVGSLNDNKAGRRITGWGNQPLVVGADAYDTAIPTGDPIGRVLELLPSLGAAVIRMPSPATTLTLRSRDPAAWSGGADAADAKTVVVEPAIQPATIISTTRSGRDRMTLDMVVTPRALTASEAEVRAYGDAMLRLGPPSGVGLALGRNAAGEVVAIKVSADLRRASAATFAMQLAGAVSLDELFRMVDGAMPEAGEIPDVSGEIVVRSAEIRGPATAPILVVDIGARWPGTDGSTALAQVASAARRAEVYSRPVDSMTIRMVIPTSDARGIRLVFNLSRTNGGFPGWTYESSQQVRGAKVGDAYGRGIVLEVAGDSFIAGIPPEKPSIGDRLLEDIAAIRIPASRLRASSVDRGRGADDDLVDAARYVAQQLDSATRSQGVLVPEEARDRLREMAYAPAPRRVLDPCPRCGAEKKKAYRRFCDNCSKPRRLRTKKRK